MREPQWRVPRNDGACAPEDARRVRSQSTVRSFRSWSEGSRSCPRSWSGDGGSTSEGPPRSDDGRRERRREKKRKKDKKKAKKEKKQAKKSGKRSRADSVDGSQGNTHSKRRRCDAGRGGQHEADVDTTARRRRRWEIIAESIEDGAVKWLRRNLTTEDAAYRHPVTQGSVLHAAVDSNRVDVIETLLALGDAFRRLLQSVDQYNRTPFELAHERRAFLAAFVLLTAEEAAFEAVRLRMGRGGGDGPGKATTTGTHTTGNNPANKWRGSASEYAERHAQPIAKEAEARCQDAEGRRQRRAARRAAKAAADAGPSATAGADPETTPPWGDGEGTDAEAGDDHAKSSAADERAYAEYSRQRWSREGKQARGGGDGGRRAPEFEAGGGGGDQRRTASATEASHSAMTEDEMATANAAKYDAFKRSPPEVVRASDMPWPLLVQDASVAGGERFPVPAAARLSTAYRRHYARQLIHMWHPDRLETLCGRRVREGDAEGVRGRVTELAQLVNRTFFA